MKLVENWREAWRWISVQAMVLALGVQGAWASLPDDLKATIPSGLVSFVSVALLALGIAGRMVKQKS